MDEREEIISLNKNRRKQKKEQIYHFLFKLRNECNRVIYFIIIIFYVYRDQEFLKEFIGNKIGMEISNL